MKRMILLVSILIPLVLISCKQPHAHNYSEIVEDVSATCLDAGWKITKCPECGDTKRVDYPATGYHMEDEGTSGTEEGHDIITYKCSVCDSVLRKVQIHSYKTEWSHDDNDHWHDALCGCTDKHNLAPHMMEISTSVTGTACVFVTHKRSECQICGHVILEDIPGTNHHEDTGTRTEPDCTTDGKIEYRCTVCHQLLRTVILDKLGHTEDSGTVTPPTCTEAGKTVYRCTRCNIQLREVPIAATGHTEDSGTVTVESTCTTTGTKEFKCTVCHEVVRTETLPALGHIENSGTRAVDPTCVNHPDKHLGRIDYNCTLCGALLRSEDIPYKPCDEDGPAIPISSPTEEADGAEYTTCSCCLTVMNERIIPRLT